MFQNLHDMLVGSSLLFCTTKVSTSLRQSNVADSFFIPSPAPQTRATKVNSPRDFLGYHIRYFLFHLANAGLVSLQFWTLNIYVSVDSVWL